MNGLVITTDMFALALILYGIAGYLRGIRDELRKLNEKEGKK